MTRLVVLVGPNGCGKSTVLDALDIAASSSPGDAVGRAVKRRRFSRYAHRWLVWQRGTEAATVRIQTSESMRMDKRAWREVRVSAEDEFCAVQVFPGRVGMGLYGDVHFKEDGAWTHEVTGSAVAPGAEFGIPHFGLVDVRGLPVRLHELYSRAVVQGQRDRAIKLVQQLLDGVTGVEILTENDEPVLHVVFEKHSVPVRLAGDGVHAALRFALELVGPPHSVFALEEPETHQHPAAIRRTAEAIVAAVRQDAQVILTTHSLELIDALVTEAQRDASVLEELTVARLALKGDGTLLVDAIRGAEVQLARTEIDSDLR